MNRSLRFFFVICCTLFLFACSSSQKLTYRDERMVRAERFAQMAQDLSNRGVKVVQAGEVVRIILPSDVIFNPHSANLSGRTNALDIVACIMVMLQTTSAEVTGYTNAEPTRLLNQVLSERQAQIIVDYLWHKGVDARLLYAVGCGASTPLSKNRGDPINRRVEIRFQYIDPNY